jgi:hypothetical protein
MSRIIPVALFCFASILLIAGCGSDSSDVVQPDTQSQNSTGVVRGEFSQGLTSFEFVADTAGDPGAPISGPFVIRGKDLHYDNELGALVVDLTVTNATEESFAEPVSLTFMQLLPPDVKVLNSDNDETGSGAMIIFEFEDGDEMWKPGEESQPRSVQFGVASGTSIGFVARIDVSTPSVGGVIGGVVWHDENEDGVIDTEEDGIADVWLVLFGGTNGDTDGSDPLAKTSTAEDGTYRFNGLDAGYYTVVRLERDDLEGTTPNEIQVLLVEDNGDVTDFLMANFGCQYVDGPDDIIKVGDCVHAKGEYATEPDRLDASRLCFCDWDDDGCDDDNQDDGDDENDDKCCPGCTGRLIGPVTEIDLESNALAVMGTWVHFEDKNDLNLEDVQVGDRVRVHVKVVTEEEEDRMLGCRLKSWVGNFDRVRGEVQEIFYDDEENITGLKLLNTKIEVPEGFDCWD